MLKEIKVFNGQEYDCSHGSPFDRGSADSWYSRGIDPHYYPNGTGNKPRISPALMSDADIAAYHAGYAFNEQFGGKKEW